VFDRVNELTRRHLAILADVARGGARMTTGAEPSLYVGTRTCCDQEAFRVLVRLHLVDASGIPVRGLVDAHVTLAGLDVILDAGEVRVARQPEVRWVTVDGLPYPAPDWDSLARRYRATVGAMLHEGRVDPSKDAFHAEALRRVFCGSDGHVIPSTGLVTAVDAHRVLSASIACERQRQERLQLDLAEARAVARGVALNTARWVVEILRRRSDEVRAKVRREGVLLAAGWVEQTALDGGDLGIVRQVASQHSGEVK